MIYGVGTDILEQARIASTWKRFGTRFSERLLMPQELKRFCPGKRPDRFLAMRFAAKEAIVKAMGTGFAHGVGLRDIGIEPNDWGRPEIIWSEQGLAVCRSLGIDGGHVSLSDDGGMILAFAVVMQASVNDN